MLSAVKNLTGDILSVKLQGMIDELSQFDQVIGSVPKELHINCREVGRVNSHGIRNWVQYFTQLAGRGVKLRFSELSPTLVPSYNLMANFIPQSAEVESICLPYSCTGCQAQLIQISTVAQLAKKKGPLPDLACPTCGKEAVFDDLEAEYLLFLTFKKSS